MDADRKYDSDAGSDYKAPVPPPGIVQVVQGAPEFLAATTAEPLNPRSRTALQLYAILLISYLNATTSGFDGSIFSSINAMTQYKDYFHMKETGASTGFVFAIYTIGVMCGAIFTGPVCDNFGRRVGMQVGAFIIMAGAAIITAAQNRSMFLAARFILGFGISISTSAAPTYATEIAPPQWRARIVGYYNSMFYSGSILATGVCYASAKMTGTVAWRLPLALQMGPPLIIFFGCFFIPESPRWQCARGKMDQATKTLAKYHGNGDVNHPVVKLEIAEFQRMIEVQKADSFWNYSVLWDTHNARWRMLMNIFMSIFAQMSGNSVLTYYLPTMYTHLGIVSTNRRLLLTFANSIVSATGAIAGSATNDAIGRRTKLWVGSLVLACLFSCVCAFSSQFATVAENEHVNSALSNAGVASIFLFGCVYSFVYTPVTAAYPAEVLTNRARAKGMGVHVVLSNIASFYNTYVTGIALNAISWQYYLVFICLDVFFAFCWWMWGVETKGRTLEELDEIFSAPFPPRASIQKKAVAIEGANARVVET